MDPKAMLEENTSRNSQSTQNLFHRVYLVSFFMIWNMFSMSYGLRCVALFVFSKPKAIFKKVDLQSRRVYHMCRIRIIYGIKNGEDRA